MGQVMTNQDTQGQKPRKERKDNANRRRRQLLDAAFRSIVVNGLARTTLATVAAEAGLSQGVAVFYYQSKSGLLTAVLEYLYQRYEEHWRRALDLSGDNPRDQLTAIIAADFHPSICNPETLSVWFAFWGEQKFTPQYRDVTNQFDQNRAEALHQVFVRLLPEDRKDEAAIYADWIDAMTDGYWQRLHLSPQEFDRQTAINSAFALVDHITGPAG